MAFIRYQTITLDGYWRTAQLKPFNSSPDTRPGYTSFDGSGGSLQLRYTTLVPNKNFWFFILSDSGKAAIQSLGNTVVAGALATSYETTTYNTNITSSNDTIIYVPEDYLLIKTDDEEFHPNWVFGARIWDGSKWLCGMPYIYDGGWKQTLPYIYSDGKWKNVGYETS